MRGRSSSAKSRLRSAGYKCNLCGRRLIDAETLERHQKTIHNISPRTNKVGFKAKPPVQKSKLTIKDKEKVFDELVKEDILTKSKLNLRDNKNNYGNLRGTVIEDLAERRKISSYQEIENNDKKNNKQDDDKEVSKRVEFECPVCAKTFNVYFTAHKHIQKLHSINADGKKVSPNSSDLIQPIRVEQCYRCDSKIRSDAVHECPKLADDNISTATEFVCSGCKQAFVSLKTFDLHVAGLHSDAVDSMFFPTKIEFTNWRLEMERQTNAKYSLYGEYELKKIYRCQHAREEAMKNKSTAFFCPSSMVVQDFSKGIQVHFYNKHYDHTSNPYTLSSKYKKYSITSFLKHPNEDSSVKSTAYSMKLDDVDLLSQFKKLMDSIVISAADVDISSLKTLIEKALEMSTVVTDAVTNHPMLKPSKIMSDREITEALEMTKVLHKRRRSADFCDTPLKPAKRTRNKSLFNQSDTRLSPKIINTFSLASNSNSDEFKSDNGDDFDFDSNVSDANEKTGSIPQKSAPEQEVETNRLNKISTRLTSFNELPSFNDSYKDFIDKNFIVKTDNSIHKFNKNTVKTKLGAFKQVSPRNVENKDNNSNDISSNKNIGGLKSIISGNTKVEEASLTSKVDTIDNERSRVNILSVETPNVTITKLKADTPKVTGSQVKPSRLDTKVSTKSNTKNIYSHTVDPLQVNIKRNRYNSSPTEEPYKGNVSKSNTRNIPSPLMDPLELNIPKVKTGSLPSAPVEPQQRNISKLNTKRISLDPLKISTTKLNSPKTDNPKSNATKSEILKYSSKGYPLGKAKGNIAKVYTHKVTSKVSPKVTFEDKVASGHSSPKITTPHKIRELKYEVREQENDCNILVLKL